MRVLTKILRFFRPDAPGGGLPPGPFEDFVAAYTERARMWLILLGVGRPDAEDIVQSALLALWEHREKVPPAARPSWLRTAIRFRVRRLRSRRSTQNRRAAPASWEGADDGSPWDGFPEEQLGDEEAVARVRELVDTLKPELSAVVRHYFLEGRRMEEVAAMLGLNVRTAWSRWWRAKRDLRALVERSRERERFKAGAASFGLLLFLAERSWSGLHDLAERATSGSPSRSGPRLRRWVRPAAMAAAFVVVITGHVSIHGLPAGPALLGAQDAGDPKVAAVTQRMEAGAVRGAAAVTSGERSPRAAETAEPSPPAHTPPADRAAPRGGTGLAARAGARSRETSREAPDPVRLRPARALLVRAGDALFRENDAAKARLLLEQYDWAYPERPYPAHRAGLAAALRGR
jgi:RNA polymerase sigma factor (sigma-70 family)